MEEEVQNEDGNEEEVVEKEKGVRKRWMRGRKR